jgi:predicted RNA-binding protein with PIN domain
VGPPTPATVLVDGNNVIGSRADGWWRDRAGAARRLVTRLQAFAAVPGAPTVEVVFDVLPRDGREGDDAGVHVYGPARRGRDAADDRIVALVAGRDDADAIEVVTSDRALADRVRSLGASVSGARAFLARLEAAGC